jgi:hypothetical protein
MRARNAEITERSVIECGQFANSAAPFDGITDADMDFHDMFLISANQISFFMQKKKAFARRAGMLKCRQWEKLTIARSRHIETL